MLSHLVASYYIYIYVCVITYAHNNTHTDIYVYVPDGINLMLHSTLWMRMLHEKKQAGESGRLDDFLSLNLRL